MCNILVIGLRWTNSEYEKNYKIDIVWNLLVVGLIELNDQQLWRSEPGISPYRFKYISLCYWKMLRPIIFFQCHWLFIWWEYFGSWHSFTRLLPKYPIIESIWYIRDERFLKYMYLEYLIQKIVWLNTMAIHCNPLRLCNMSGNHGPNICPLYTHDCNKFFMLYQRLILLIWDVLCSIFAVFHLTIVINDF